MKKKIFKWGIYSIVFFLVILLGTFSFKRIREKKTIEKNIQTLHGFCAFSIGDNREFCTESLSNKPIIILFMNPECDFCQEEIKQIKKDQTRLKDVSVLLVTHTSLQQAIDFYSTQNLSLFDNIRLLSDEDIKIYNQFDIKTIPTIFIYDKNKKLIFTHKGEIKIEALTRYFAEE